MIRVVRDTVGDTASVEAAGGAVTVLTEIVDEPEVYLIFTPAQARDLSDALLAAAHEAETYGDPL